MAKAKKRKKTKINKKIQRKIQKIQKSLVLLIISVIISVFFGLNINNESQKITQYTNNIEETVKYKVIKVSDGDTLSVKKEVNGKLVGDAIKVRMHGIDAPETAQEYGKESRDALARKVLNKTVDLEIKSKDRYGRSVAVVWLNERNINAEMIRDGNAWYYEQYDKDNEVSRIYQENARKNQLGLFARRKYEEPWKYRERKRRE